MISLSVTLFSYTVAAWMFCGTVFCGCSTAAAIDPPATREVTIRVEVRNASGDPVQNVRVMRSSSRYQQEVNGYYSDQELTDANGQAVLLEPNIPAAMEGPLSVTILTGIQGDPAATVLGQLVDLEAMDIWKYKLYTGVLSTTSDEVSISVVLHPSISIDGRVVMSEVPNRILVGQQRALTEIAAAPAQSPRIDVYSRMGLASADTATGEFVIPRQTKSLDTDIFVLSQYQGIAIHVPASTEDVHLGDQSFVLESAATELAVKLIVDPSKSKGDATTDGFTLIRLSDKRIWTYPSYTIGRTSPEPIRLRETEELPRVSPGQYAVVPGRFTATAPQLRVYDAIRNNLDIAAHGIPVIDVPPSATQVVAINVDVADVFTGSKELQQLVTP